MMIKKGLICIIGLAIVSCSCQKVIPVKLDGSDPQIVIEGEITANKGPYKVLISQSINFDASNSFSGRNDAKVSIKDMTSGITETLKNIGSGAYHTVTLLGIGGHSYQLTVVLGDKTYTAVSTIPLKAVRITSLFAKKFALDSEDVYMVPVFTDPVGKGNYYRLRQYVNGVQIKGSYVRNDEATDGRRYDGQLYYSLDAADGNPVIHNGDKITAELQCVDKGAYDYFRTLSSTIDQDSSTQSNPLTNITGGAIGVFNACRSNSLTVTAKF